MNLNNHPCFNIESRHTTGRIHLPIAPKCNVQCNYCNRKFDCLNESRPGVTSTLMTVTQAIEYLSKRLNYINKNISVIGIAGPGDPFANPEETIECLERLRSMFSEKLLCLSSNGLAVSEYIQHLVSLRVSHVTITINAVNPEIGANIYKWVNYNNKIFYGNEGATILLEKQTEAIKLLKANGIITKINTVVIPNVNEHHIVEIAKYILKLGVNIQNCIPLMPIAETLFENIEEPAIETMNAIRGTASCYIQQMFHCVRCRADAFGLLCNNTFL